MAKYFVVNSDPQGRTLGLRLDGKKYFFKPGQSEAQSLSGKLAAKIVEQYRGVLTVHVAPE